MATRKRITKPAASAASGPLQEAIKTIRGLIETEPDPTLAREYHAKRLDMAERGLMPQVLEGDIGARRRALNLIAEAISECRYFPPQISAFVAHGIQQIAQDKGELKAPFGIKLKRGQKRHHQTIDDGQRQFRRAYQVECLVLDGATVEAAIADVAEADGVPEDTVKGAWKKKHKLAKRDIELQQKHLGRVMRI